MSDTEIKDDVCITEDNQSSVTEQENNIQDEFEKINPNDYNPLEETRKFFDKIFLLTDNGKKILPWVIMVLVGAFFALPGVMSIMSFILPAKQFLNYIATETLDAMKFFVRFIIPVSAYLCGRILYGLGTNKLNFRPTYNNFGEFIKKNIVSIVFGIVLILMTVSSLLYAPDLKKAFTNQTDGIYVAYYIAGACFVASFVRDRKALRLLLMIFTVSACLMSAVMFRQFVEHYYQVSFKEYLTLKKTSIHPSAIKLRNIRGIFSNSNHCGYFMAMALLCAGGLIITANKAWKKIVWGVCFAIITNILIINNTAGSLLAAFLVVVLAPIAFIGTDIKINNRFIPLALLIVVSVLVSAFPNSPTGSETLKDMAKEFLGDSKKLTESLQVIKDNVNAAMIDTSKTKSDSEQSTMPEITSSSVATEIYRQMASESAETKDNTKKDKAKTGGLPMTRDVRNKKKAKYVDTGEWWLNHQELGTSRLGLWQYGIELIRHKPLLGYGRCGSADKFANESHLKEPASRLHNEYLQNAVDFGIPCAVLYLGAFIYAVILFFKNLKTGKLRNEHRILFTMFAAYCISACFGIATYYVTSYFFIMFALLMTGLEGADFPTDKKTENTTDGTDDTENDSESDEDEEKSPEVSGETSEILA